MDALVRYRPDAPMRYAVPYGSASIRWFRLRMCVPEVEMPVYADPWSSPERAELRSLVAGFTKREIVPYLSDWERDGLVPRELHRKAGALGLLGVGFPESVGGGGDAIGSFIVSEEVILNGGSIGVCAALFTLGIAIPHIVESGNLDLIERYAIPTISGELIGALGITEPGMGSDVASLRTRAMLEGEEYVVNGAKMFITSGIRADYVTTAVRTGEGGHRGISLLVIPKDAEGFVVGAPLEKMGWLCSDTAELFFDDVKVPGSNIVGEVNTGFYQIMRHFQRERLAMAVQAVASAQRCVDLSRDWLLARTSFGELLATKQVLRHRLADMATEAEVARTYVRHVALRWLSGEDVNMEIAMAKNVAVKACDHVVDQAVQIHGGLGYMRATEVERHYRDARIMGIGGGTSEIMNEIIAKRIL